MTENDRAFRDISLQLLRQGQSVRFRPGGHSMRPAINDGEAVLVEPVNPARIRLGEIILYLFERGVIAHRVQSIEQSAVGLVFTTRGDTSHAADAPVAEADVLGRVVAVERAGRVIYLAGRRARWRRLVRRAASRVKSWLHRR